MAGLELLVNNSVQHLDLEHVQVDLEIARERKTATIESASPPGKFNVRPGENVDVLVTLRPYRAASETRMLRLQIPADTAPPGLMTVTVRGGAADHYTVKPPPPI